jgi:serpin B
LSKYFAQSGIKLWKVNLPAINQKVDNIVVAQTAKIKVDEEGTEAAAITNTTDFSTANDKKVFTANRTFAYVIRESASKAILFMGKITDPSQTKSND